MQQQDHTIISRTCDTAYHQYSLTTLVAEEKCSRNGASIQDDNSLV